MNLVLEDAEEVDTKNNTRLKIGKLTLTLYNFNAIFDFDISYFILGRLMLKGDNITLIQGVEN
jgi:small nuclear ribonucleoprotein (snRNP)-like protein